MNLLKIDKLSLRFLSSGKFAVKDIDLSIDYCQTLGLVGQSGSGKSSVALSILQLHKKIEQQGSIKFKDQELLGASESAMRSIRGNRISIVFQDPLSALNPLHTIEDQIGETLRIHGKERNVRDRVLELMDMVEISDLKNRLRALPHQLSGGQRQRVMIAIALANNPDLLIADEPTSALDVVTQMQIIKLMEKLKKRLSILFISHNLAVVRRIADKIGVIHEGAICEVNDKKKIYESPQHHYTKKLLNYTLSKDYLVESNTEFDALVVKDLTVKFSSGIIFKKYTTLIENLSFSLKEGCTLGVAGVSGSGKSTLARAILKLIDSEGQIYINNHPVHNNKYPLRKFRQDMQIIFQDPFASLDPHMRIHDIINQGIKLHKKISNDERLKLIHKTLQDVQLPLDILSKYPHQCSGGENQRIAIARILVIDPKLIILDEPTSSLDCITQGQILKLLASLQRQYKLTYLFISHDLQVLRKLSHFLMIMQNGKIIEFGSTQSVLNAPQNEYTQKLIDASFDL